MFFFSHLRIQPKFFRVLFGSCGFHLLVASRYDRWEAMRCFQKAAHCEVPQRDSVVSLWFQLKEILLYHTHSLLLFRFVAAWKKPGDAAVWGFSKTAGGAGGGGGAWVWSSPSASCSETNKRRKWAVAAEWPASVVFFCIYSQTGKCWKIPGWR